MICPQSSPCNLHIFLTFALQIVVQCCREMTWRVIPPCNKCTPQGRKGHTHFYRNSLLGPPKSFFIQIICQKRSIIHFLIFKNLSRPTVIRSLGKVLKTSDMISLDSRYAIPWKTAYRKQQLLRPGINISFWFLCEHISETKR